jgi:hypothetical protein
LIHEAEPAGLYSVITKSIQITRSMAKQLPCTWVQDVLASDMVGIEDSFSNPSHLGLASYPPPPLLTLGIVLPFGLCIWRPGNFSAYVGV